MVEYIKIIVSNFPSKISVHIKSTHRLFSRIKGRIRLRLMVKSQTYFSSFSKAFFKYLAKIKSSKHLLESTIKSYAAMKAIVRSNVVNKARPKAHLLIKGVVTENASVFASFVRNIRILKFYKISERKDMKLHELGSMTIQDFIFTENF